MYTQRFNIFDFIHKAWRAMLYETALQMQQTDFDDPLQAEKALKQLESVLAAFAHHAHNEDTFVFPAVEKYDPELAMEMHNDHGKDEVLTYQMENKIDAFRNAVTAEAKQSLGRELMYLFIDFAAFNLSHMNMEERVINEVLWKHFTDNELLQINDTIVKSIPAEEMMFTLGWMIKGISTQQLIGMLGDLRDKMPEMAYEALWQTAKRSLPSDRWEKVEASLLPHMELR